MSGTPSNPPTCHRHGENKVLRRDGQERPLRWCCRRCHAEKQRLWRDRQRNRKARKHLAHALDLRRTTARHAAEVDALVRVHGGWPQMFAALSMEERARLAFRSIEADDMAARKAAEQHHQEQVLRQQEEVLASDPQVQRVLFQMGVEYLHQHPEQLEPHVAGIIARKPSILRDALQRRTVKALLTQWGYRREG